MKVFFKNTNDILKTILYIALILPLFPLTLLLVLFDSYFNEMDGENNA